MTASSNNNNTPEALPYEPVSTPKTVEVDGPRAYVSISIRPVLYLSAAIALLQSLQFGWSVSQLNLATFNDDDDCKARPVKEGTCIMFPGHTKAEWTWVVNLWVVGGMLGSLTCGRFSDAIGRKKAMVMGAVFMIAGAAIMAAANSIAVFSVGRFIAGIASGFSSAVPNGYINEITPPHLRNRFGIGYQIAVTIGIVLVGLTFFFADTNSGWRYIAGFPIVLASFLLLGYPFMVESPTWLLVRGRREEAENEIARLYGRENVKLALSWMEEPRVQVDAENPADTDSNDASDSDAASDQAAANPWKALFSSAYRQQALLAVMLSLAQQFSGINAVFFYSSDMFKDAGLSDTRIGSTIVNIVNMLPVFVAGALGTKFGNRKMILFGHVGMLICAICMTVSLLVSLPAVSIVFTAIYVAIFEVSLGPLVFVIATSIFPNELRASGTSLCLFANWAGTLVVGIGYPYVSDALGDWGFVPFWVTLTLFGLYMVKFLPETTGKTDEEVQQLFRRRQLL
ncbi:hypothetical protein P43SY_005221 [Pythium insidiosum]|uniref:Hexose transporter 1 n=1 Tax=Pythium insidiosum TaxID=114742 RepID=A0AAD5MGJ7_PYTIN|nr:hypothetical protein P43SY_005221 [Pythium insidiosum]KAJ0411239.1 hypothetical protein ATCC90586_003878 [Pythium insidiosum]